MVAAVGCVYELCIVVLDQPLQDGWQETPA